VSQLTAENVAINKVLQLKSMITLVIVL